MSIWSTQWDAEIPARTEYGEDLPEYKPGYVFVCRSGMSSVLRLSVDDPPRPLGSSSSVTYLTPAEARDLAKALIGAAEAMEADSPVDYHRG